MPDLEKFIRQVHEVDSKYADDPPLRRYHMERLRNVYFEVSIAERLGRLPTSAGKSEQDLRAEARGILSKPGQRANLNDPEARRRTSDEERFLVSARVAWHKLLKSEGVASARPRSKSASLTALTGAAPKLRRLAGLRSSPDEGAVVLQQYVAKHAGHLIDICEYAKRIHPRFVSPKLERALAELSAACSAG